MSQTDKADHRARCEQLLHEAEAYEKVGDWENAVVKYRHLNELDHLFQGAEAKLLFALTERDAGRLYNEGKAHMAAGRYAEAREALHKAKTRAGVYKDTIMLIKECDQQLSAATTITAQPAATTRRGCLSVLPFFLH